MEPGADETSSIDALAADTRIVAAARRRIRPHVVADRGTGLLLGGSFLVVLAAWLLAAPPTSVPLGVLAACVAVYAVAASVEFEIGPGCALPTTPVQIVMLFLLPPPLVPLGVLLGLVAASWWAAVRDPERRERLTVLAASAWQSVGPAAVFAWAIHAGLDITSWQVVVLALAAQFAIDFAVSWIRTCCGLGVPRDHMFRGLRFAFACDLGLAPVGYAAALAFPGSVAGLVILLPPILLLAALQSDRRAHIDRAVALGLAYTDTSDLARTDPLTGIANRLAFEEASARVRDAPAPVGVVLADVDGLKRANDEHGHPAGDRLLVAVAGTIAEVAEGRGASTFRIGGDEFAVLLLDADLEILERLGHELRAALAAAAPIDGSIPVSASVGVGLAPHGIALGPAIATADAAATREKAARGIQRR